MSGGGKEDLPKVEFTRSNVFGNEVNRAPFQQSIVDPLTYQRKVDLVPLYLDIKLFFESELKKAIAASHMKNNMMNYGGTGNMNRIAATSTMGDDSLKSLAYKAGVARTQSERVSFTTDDNSMKS